MKLAEVRTQYLEFWKSKEHKIIPSAPLVPQNDPTTLFTGSGMQPLVPYLLGAEHPEGKRLANSQKCFRAEDIEEVGDNRHTTFFEMLGNWSLGDYWKEEQLSGFFEFLTKEIKIPKEKLYVSCFEGDTSLNLPKDTESAEIWKKIGIPENHIFFYDAKKNWWSRSGTPDKMPVGEPGGPDSEVFYEFKSVEHDQKFGEKCHPNCDCGRFMEIGNSVFMQYKKTANGFQLLPRRNVDFGGGLERITAASNDSLDIFEIDALKDIKSVLEDLETKSPGRLASKSALYSYRVVADHVRAVVFLISDGVTPSNIDRGYFARRLIRRAVRHLDLLGIGEGNLHRLVTPIARAYREAYPAVQEQALNIENEIKNEEDKFRKTLKAGLKEFEKLSTTPISGKDAFMLFSTYGFPIDLSLDLAKEKAIVIDIEGFKEEYKKHQDISRQGADKKFKGGLADTSEMSVKYHTATHVLHKALREVLGTHVEQRGSNITTERLRFDFAHPQKMTDEEKAAVEEIVNEKINAALPVNKVILKKEEAEKSGALHFFGEKYGDEVSVYFIGDSLENAYSKEFCGGPHVTNTSVLGTFKIQKEEAVSAGVRRIKAILK
ncbi:MAG TPA: alanine--tRNA ligase [Candidatus Paceibacterota bacterium]